jgi:hypothetical protein
MKGTNSRQMLSTDVTVDKDWHRRKHSWQMLSTDEGMQIDESEEQSSNTEALIHLSFELDANVTASRDRHSRNEELPIHESLEPDSNSTLKRAEQPRKQES